jgi:hypothetical protein
MALAWEALNKYQEWEKAIINWQEEILAGKTGRSGSNSFFLMNFIF